MQQGLPSLPAAATTVVNFLGHMHGKGVSFSTAKVYLFAIANNHRESQHADPTSSDMVVFALKGYQRLKPSTSDSRLPITLDVMRHP